MECMEAVQLAVQNLRQVEFPLPRWSELREGLRPENFRELYDADPGEWPHGWQFHACRAVEDRFCTTDARPLMDAAHEAWWRSCRGKHSGAWLRTMPASPATLLDDVTMQIAMCRRLRLPIGVARGPCPSRTCRAVADPMGDHLAACMHTGRVQRRGKAFEAAWALVLREAGSSTQVQVPAGDLVDEAGPGDELRFDAVSYGLSFTHGSALCVDCTLVSPLRGNGAPTHGAHAADGAAIAYAEAVKAARYRAVSERIHGQYVTLAAEIGGRFSDRCITLVADLIRHRIASEPRIMQRSAAVVWSRRWWGILSCAIQAATARTLLRRFDTWAPPMLEIDDEDVWAYVTLPPEVSRLA